MVAASSLKNSLRVNNVNVYTGSSTITMTNEGIVVVNKTVGAATAVTLPSTPATGDHRIIKDGKGDAATNNITITPASGNIDGAATYVISENYGGVILEYNGTEWGVVGQTNSVSAAELAFLNGVTAGTVTASKAVVVDANRDVGTLRHLTINGNLVSNATTISEADLIQIDGLTPGTAVASKAVVLDAGKGISTITNATITNLVTGGIEKNTDVGTLAAAGTVIANAAAIVNAVTIVTGADDAAGVVLPTAVAGKVLEIYSNQATNGLKVYPPVNGTINDGSANAAIVIEGKSFAYFRATNATNWAAIFTTNS